MHSTAEKCAGWRYAALIGLLALAAASDAAEPPVRQVLVLQSFSRGNLILDHFTTNFRVDLEQRAGGPVNFVQVTVGPTGFVGAPDQAVVDFIRSTFADRPKPDLIVTIAGPAAVFARKYRQQLFPDTPMLFGAVDERYLRDAPLGENETAVAVLNDFPGLVDDILQVRPQTRQVFMIVGSGPIGKFWRSSPRGTIQPVSRSTDICMVRGSLPSGDRAPLLEPAGEFGDHVPHARHRCVGSRICGRAGSRRSSCDGECATVLGAQRVSRLRHRGRQADGHR